MRIQIVYKDGTQKVWETQGVPAGREGVPTAYGIEWDLFLKHPHIVADGKPTGEKRVALILTTTASSAEGEVAEPDSAPKSKAPQARASAAKIAASNIAAIEKEAASSAHDTDVKIIAKLDYRGPEIDTVPKLMDALTERGGVARMVVDGEVVYPSPLADYE